MATRTYNLKPRPAGLTGSDPYNFEVSVAEFAKVMKLNHGKVLAAASLELRRKIMRANPVDTGRSRDSWQVTVGSPSDYVPPLPWGPEKNWPPPPPESALAAIIDGTKPIFIVSNVPYVEALEFGYSAQAPQGMVRISVLSLISEMDSIAKRALAGQSFTS